MPCEYPDVTCQAQTSNGHACYFTESHMTVTVTSPSIAMFPLKVGQEESINPDPKTNKQTEAQL